MAFHELAIQPSAIRTLRDFRLVWNMVGFPRGRLISDYPRRGKDKAARNENWAWHVIESIRQHDPRNYNLVREILITEHRTRLLAGRRDFDYDSTWLENARKEHQREPFGAIVAEGISAATTECSLDEIGGAECPECLKDEQNVFPLPKTPAAFAKALFPMLRCAKDIRFVDPYYLKFDRESRRVSFSREHAQVVMEIAARLSDLGRIPQSVEFHFKVFSDHPEEDLDLFVDEMKDYLPRHWEATAVGWGKKPNGGNFHARYLLTDLAGAGSEYGFDKGRSSSDETDVFLLPESLRLARWNEFCQKTRASDFVAGPRFFRGIRG